jgi:hypothetical protein
MKSIGKGVVFGLFAIFISLFSIPSEAATGGSSTTSASASASASAQASSTISSILSMSIKSEGDDAELAHKYFKQIFGGFIYTPWGAGDSGDITIISRAVGFTNILALFLGLVIVFYVMIGGALNTAHQGEVLGKSWSSIWLPVRTALGFGLIMPAAGIGGGVMSVAQMFIIWVIVMGSNAATVLWNSLASNLSAGAPITSAIPSPGITPSADMLKMLACTDAYIRQKTMGKTNLTNGDATAYTVVDSSNKSKSYPAKGNDAQNGSLSIGNQSFSSALADAQSIEFGNNGVCGSITFSPANFDVAAEIKGNDYRSLATKAAIIKARSIVAENLNSLLTIVQTINNMETGGPIAINTALADGDTEASSVARIEIFNKAVADFQAAASVYATSIVSKLDAELSGSASVAAQWKKNITKGGWMKAGVWYHELSAFASMSFQVISQINSQIKPNIPSVCYYAQFEKDQDDCELKNKQLSETIKLVETIASKAVTNVKSSGGNNLLNSADIASSKCGDGNSCSGDTGILSDISSRLARGILNTFASGNDPVGSTTGIESPFQTVASIGHNLNSTAAYAWTIGMVTWGGIEGMKGAGDTWLGNAIGVAKIAAFTASGVLQWILMSLTALLASIVTLGFVLAYLIPFLPVVTWITMISGYLLTVVEATIAAPLAIILMVTPEGEGIAGSRLERAMQLLAMAVLKPSLMIIGMIASISLSYVCFSMMNLFFFQASENVLEGSPFDFIAIMIVYTTTVFQLCKLMISIMHKLPDQILDWFSSGVGRQFGEGETSQHMEGSINQMKQGVGGIASAIGNRAGERRRMRKQG